MLIVMDKSTHEERLSQPLQIRNEQLKIAVSFLTSYNGIFNVKISNYRFYFMKSNTHEDVFLQITIPPGAYEIESLNNEIKRTVFDEEQYNEPDYPFSIKPNFSTLGSILGISPQGPIISFMFDESIRDLLGSDASTL